MLNIKFRHMLALPFLTISHSIVLKFLFNLNRIIVNPLTTLFIIVKLKNGTVYFRNSAKVTVIDEESRNRLLALLLTKTLKGPNGVPIESMIHLDNSILTFNQGDVKVSFHITSTRRLIDLVLSVWGLYLHNEYNIEGEMFDFAVDIGSFVGDSPILFALKGASRVLGVEASPSSYIESTENISLNNLNERIKVLNSCVGQNRDLVVNNLEYTPLGFVPINDNKGVLVKSIKFEELMTNNPNFGKSILKLDCEGCEYDIITEVNMEQIKKFKTIVLEYHKGYKNLDKLLSKNGYEVSVEYPRIRLTLSPFQLSVYGIMKAQRVS